jgi:hypothetical protein
MSIEAVRERFEIAAKFHATQELERQVTSERARASCARTHSLILRGPGLSNERPRKS